MVGSGKSRERRTHERSRGSRRLMRRVRRMLTWRSAAAVALFLLSFAVVTASLTGPPSRGNVFRTDPVLRAMGVPEDGPDIAFEALGAVPSLSVSPRFVLPMLRDGSKRTLAPLPPPAPVVATAEPEPAPTSPPQKSAAPVPEEQPPIDLGWPVGTFRRCRLLRVVWSSHLPVAAGKRYRQQGTRR